MALNTSAIKTFLVILRRSTNFGAGGMDPALPRISMDPACTKLGGVEAELGDRDRADLRPARGMRFVNIVILLPTW